MSNTSKQQALVDYFDPEYKKFREVIGKAHQTGFSNPYLHGCLYIYAGGGSTGSDSTEGYLREFGLIAETESGHSLTNNGEKLLNFLHYSTTGKTSIAVQEIVEKANGQEKVANVLKLATLEIT